MVQARERAVWEKIVAEVEAGTSRSAGARRYGVSVSGSDTGYGHSSARMSPE